MLYIEATAGTWEQYPQTRLRRPKSRRGLARRMLISSAGSRIQESGADDIVPDATRWRFPSSWLCPGAADPCRRVIDNWCMRELTVVITAPHRDPARMLARNLALRLLGWRQGRLSGRCTCDACDACAGTALFRRFTSLGKGKKNLHPSICVH